MRGEWSPRVEKLEKIFKPYWVYGVGVKENAPQEAKEASKEYCELVKKKLGFNHFN